MCDECDHYKTLAEALQRTLVRARRLASRREAELELKVHELRGQIEDLELERQKETTGG